MIPHTLGIVGLGAIGGSVAWAAARAGIPRIIGYSKSRKDGVAAVRHGAVTELATDLPRALRGVEFLVIAVPPGATIEVMRATASQLKTKGVFCTDVASVKGPVMRAAETLGLQEVFAGSHPFAGSHRPGFGGAAPDRLSGAVIYVSPLRDGDRAAREVCDFWTRVVSAHPVQVSAEEHDALVAWTSHLPQAVSSALAVTLARHGARGMRLGTGAQSATRLAGGDVTMWTDVLLMNREAVIAGLASFDHVVSELTRALNAGDAEGVSRWLEQGAHWRRAVEP